jgi:hypothetical protein
LAETERAARASMSLMPVERSLQASLAAPFRAENKASGRTGIEFGLFGLYSVTGPPREVIEDPRKYLRKEADDL